MGRTRKLGAVIGLILGLALTGAPNLAIADGSEDLERGLVGVGTLTVKTHNIGDTTYPTPTVEVTLRTVSEDTYGSIDACLSSDAWEETRQVGANGTTFTRRASNQRNGVMIEKDDPNYNYYCAVLTGVEDGYEVVEYTVSSQLTRSSSKAIPFELISTGIGKGVFSLTIDYYLAPTCEDCDVEVEPVAPTLTNPACDVAPDVVIPEVPGVIYEKSPGEDGTVSVVASPAPGYVFPEGAQTSWTFDLSVEPCPPGIEAPAKVVITARDVEDPQARIPGVEVQLRAVTADRHGSVEACTAPNAEQLDSQTDDKGESVLPVRASNVREGELLPLDHPQWAYYCATVTGIPEGYLLVGSGAGGWGDTPNLRSADEMPLIPFEIVYDQEGPQSLQQDIEFTFMRQCDDCDLQVTPVAPELSEVACEVEPEIILPQVEGVHYGTEAISEGKIVVTAEPLSGYEFDPAAVTSWTFSTNAQPCPTLPPGPEVTTPGSGESGGTELAKTGATLGVVLVALAGLLGGGIWVRSRRTL